MELNKKLKLNTNETLILRTATLLDAQNLVEYYNKLYIETDNFTRGKEDAPLVLEKEIEYLKNQNFSRNVMLIAIIDKKIVGHAVITEKSAKMRLKHRCEFSIGVLKEQWGKGVAGKMMVEIIELAKKMNYEQIDLVVLKSNTRALNLYNSFGFEQTGEIRHSFKMEDGHYEDGVFMTKFLTNVKRV